MEFLLSPFYLYGWLLFPNELTGWLFALGMGLIIAWLLWRFRELNLARHEVPWSFVGFLVLLFLLVNSFLAFQIHILGLPSAPLVLILSAVPWMIAAMVLGPVAATLFGFFSGLFSAYFSSHSAFVPLITALLALVFALAMKRVPSAGRLNFMRKPIASALLLSMMFPFLYFVSSVWLVEQGFGTNFEYLMLSTIGESLVFISQTIAGAWILKLIANEVPASWAYTSAAPAAAQPKRKQGKRVGSQLSKPALVAVFSALLFAFALWLFINGLVRQKIVAEMETTGASIEAQLIEFDEAAQAFLIQIRSNPALLLEGDANTLLPVLASYVNEDGYFNQLSLFEPDQQLAGSFPELGNEGYSFSPDEMLGFDLALAGLPIQSFSAFRGSVSQLHYLLPLVNTEGQVARVLMTSTTINQQAYFSEIENSMTANRLSGGDVFLVGPDQTVLLATNALQAGSFYTGETYGNSQALVSYNLANQKVLRHDQILARFKWTLVQEMPMVKIQQISFRWYAIAMGFGVVVGVALFLSKTFRQQRNLSRQLKRSAFVRSPKKNPILSVGKSVQASLQKIGESLRQTSPQSSSPAWSPEAVEPKTSVPNILDMEGSIRAMLEETLSFGASAARLVFDLQAAPDIPPNLNKKYAVGVFAGQYAAVDEQIVALARHRREVLLSDLSRSELIHPHGLPLPASLMAFTVQMEGRKAGVLWVAYESLHRFRDEEIAFLRELADRLGENLGNAQLYSTALLGRQRLEAVLLSTPDPVLVIDHEKKLLLVNAAAKELIGDPFDSLPGTPLQAMKLPNTLKDMISSGGPQSDGLEVLIDARTYNAYVSSINVDGQNMGRVCILRDVSSFKKGEALKTEFVSTVSHELRTPLTLAHGSATMLQNLGTLSEEQNEFVEKIINEINGMKRMVNNLLEIDRFEEAQGLQLEQVRPIDAAQDAADALQILARQKNIRLLVEPTIQESLQLTADPMLLRQALHNLIENAILYTEQGGTVRVRIKEAAGQLIFEVEDTGVGIGPIDQSKVFNRFYRVAGVGDSKEHRSGLGLSIVKSIAEKHGGRVWLESQLGVGSRFYLSLPLRG